MEQVKTPLKRQTFTKYTHVNSPTPTANDYKQDECGRQYRGTATSKWSQWDEFVANSNFVKPRYIFKLKAKRNQDSYKRLRSFYTQRYDTEL